MNQNLIQLLLSIPAVLIALTVHEYFHGLAAYKLGDPTARAMGRLSLNPFRHLDIVGTLCMIFFRFGWARPVPIDVRYFKRPKRDMALVAISGPLSNFALSILSALLYLLTAFLIDLSAPILPSSRLLLGFFYYLLVFLYLFHFLNLTLGLFNCIPIPPLDGSRVLLAFLPPRLYFKVMKYEQYISLALMLLLYLGVFDLFLSGAASFLSEQIFALFRLIPIFN